MIFCPQKVANRPVIVRHECPAAATRLGWCWRVDKAAVGPWRSLVRHLRPCSGHRICVPPLLNDQGCHHLVQCHSDGGSGVMPLHRPHVVLFFGGEHLPRVRTFPWSHVSITSPCAPPSIAASLSFSFPSFAFAPRSRTVNLRRTPSGWRIL